MNNLVFNGQHVAPELSKKLFEHYPKLEMQLDVLVRVTHEMECLVEKTNAVFGDSESQVSGVIERARDVAMSTSLPVSAQPQLATPSVPEAPPVENVAAIAPAGNVTGESQGNQSDPPASMPDQGIPDQGKAVLSATGHLMHKLWTKM